MNTYQRIAVETARAHEIKSDEQPPRKMLAIDVAIQTRQLVAALAMPGAFLYHGYCAHKAAMAWIHAPSGVPFSNRAVKRLERQGRLRARGNVLTLA